jgi:hydrogenase-4 membrane subunit HyfE
MTTLSVTVDALAACLLFSALLIVATPRLPNGLAALTLQSALLAGLAFVIAIATGAAHVYIAALLTLAVKVIIGPMVMVRVLSRVRQHKEEPVILSTRVAVVLALGLVFVAYESVGRFELPGAVHSQHALPVSVALMLLGLYLMVIRRKAMFQIFGLLTMENGVYLAALVATFGLPMAVELAVFFDVLVGLLIMGVFVSRISESIETINTDRLSRLRW